MLSKPHSGMNFGALYRVPSGPVKIVNSTSSGTVDQSGLSDDTTSKQLRRRISRRSSRFKGAHRHREGDVKNPFSVTLRDEKTSSVRDSKKRFDFVVMQKGATIDVEIDDREGDQFYFRRFLTPHILQGDGLIDVSDLVPDFLHRRTKFSVTAIGLGLVRILGLDMLGRCRGELVISIKNSRGPLSVAFVRPHNGEVDGKLRHASSLPEGMAAALVSRINDVLQGQTGFSFSPFGAPIPMEVPFDLSNGLTSADWEAHISNNRNAQAPFTVYLFKKFKKPFMGGNEATGVSIGGHFVNHNAAVIGLSDEPGERAYVVLAHEICHTLIARGQYADLDLGNDGHYQDKGIKGLLMSGKIQSELLRWRDVNVINPSGLGTGGLAALKSNRDLWRGSGS